MGLATVEAESDSEEVIQNFSGEEQMWNEATTTYADCFVNAEGIGKVEFHHCVRDCNAAAHEVARSCFNTKSSYNWVDELPSFIP
jgi:hypothetical protein